MGSGRALLGFVLCVSAAGSPGCARAGRGAAHQRPEDVWLARIGTGPAQTARVCGRGATDRIATTLCDQATPPIRGLTDLYRALRLDKVGERLVAVTTHSLGLSARTVSALNPRVMVYQNISHKRRPITIEEVVVTGFTRGEQLVELAALDPASYDYNFYLLRFAQACNRTRCTPEDLLTEKVESGWTDWTLYSERDLEDTALDCASCHQPFGAGTHKQLLMRQDFDPWMHWGDFRGGDERTLCRTPDFEGTVGKTVLVAEGLDLLRAVEGAGGRYAGVPVAELHASESGKIFATFVVDAESAVRNSPYPVNYQYEQLSFATREVVCERFRTGTSPTWDRHRRESLERGLPVPYYGPDVVDARRRAEVAADRAGFLRRHADHDAFDVAASFINAEVATAVGFLPRKADTAPEMLRSLCVRCHSAKTDARLVRARFNAEAIDRVEPVTANAIRRRLSLPKTSSLVMPPARVGELPSWAIARIDRYLRDHCANPGACD